MKRTFILIVVAGLLNSACEDLRSRDFFGSGNFTYSPVKDTFTIGDTLWMSFTIPKNISNDFFDICLDGDSLSGGLFIEMVEILNSTDTVGQTMPIFYDKWIIKTGSVSDKYFFIYDEIEKHYMFEMGIKLENPGMFFITSHYMKDKYFFLEIDDIPGLGPHCGDHCSRSGGGRFCSTFSETGNGWFQFVVTE